MENKKVYRDGHIHSHYCPHGTKDPFHSYIEKALSLGLKEISFTEHMPIVDYIMDRDFLNTCSPGMEEIEEYFKELDIIKKKYNKVIKINSGLEIDYLDGLEKSIKDNLDRFGEYIEDSILSVHIIKFEDKYYCIDYNIEKFSILIEKVGGLEKLYDKYFETLLKAIKSDLGFYKPKRIGHPTLIRIFNKKFPIDYKNNDILEEIVKEIKKRDMEIDYNTAGLRKPYCGEIYPNEIFYDLVKKYEVRIVYGSDAHKAEDLGKDF